MSPWEVIQEALLHKRPVRNQQWLAEQLGVSIQVVNNWKTRGVPARRYRDIAEALGITLDQIEGVEPLPWLVRQEQAESGLSPAVAQIAGELEQLQPKQLEFVLGVLQQTLATAKQFIQPTESALTTSEKRQEHAHQGSSPKRRISR